MLEGFLFIDKPAGRTSFSCVQYIKQLLDPSYAYPGLQARQATEGYLPFRRSRVGHGGTLDKFATGLIVVGIGRSATRMMSNFLHLDKEYIAQGKIGELTDTLDPNGQIIKKVESATLTQEQLQHAITEFKGSYEQIPPAYSALWHQGKRLYELAQKRFSDKQIASILEAKKRTVFCYALELTSFTYPFFELSCHVSHGTYIRSLVNDIAQKVGTCATTVQLQRTAIGPFSLNQAIKLEAITSEDDIRDKLIPVDVIKGQL